MKYWAQIAYTTAIEESVFAKIQVDVPSGSNLAEIILDEAIKNRTYLVSNEKLIEGNLLNDIKFLKPKIINIYYDIDGSADVDNPIDTTPKCEPINFEFLFSKINESNI